MLGVGPFVNVFFNEIRGEKQTVRVVVNGKRIGFAVYVVSFVRVFRVETRYVLVLHAV